MRRAFVVFPAVVLLLAISPTFSAPTLDQHQDLMNDSQQLGVPSPGAPIVPIPLFGQTFTAGLSGLLDRIEVGMKGYGLPFPISPITVEIRDTLAGAPGSNILGSVYISSVLYEGWNSIDFRSLNISMSPGSMYSIVLWNDDQFFMDAVNVETWKPGVDPDPYMAGQFWSNGGFGWRVFFGDTQWYADMQFRTYVDVGTGPTIPAPGAIVLAGIGATLVGWLRRRRTV